MKTNRPTTWKILPVLLCPSLLQRLKIAVLIESLAFFFIGCATSTDAPASGQTYQAPPAVNISQKIKVTLGEIKNETGVHSETEGTGTTIQTGAAAAPPDKKITVRDPIGTGARDQLMTALMDTRIFMVVEDEKDAQYRIQGGITGYDPNQSSTAGGFGWGQTRRPSDPTVSPGNVFVQVLSPNAVAGYSQKGYIAVNVHLFDERQKGFVASTAIKAHPKSSGAGGNLSSALPSIGRAFGFSVPEGAMVDAGHQSRKPLQESIQDCMNQAAMWVREYVLANPVAEPSSNPSAPVQANASSPTSAGAAPPPQPTADAITMKDGSVIKGVIETATLKFKTAYGEMNVQTSDIVEFKDGFLILRDGGKTKGSFDGITVVTKTAANVMNLPGGDVVSIQHPATIADNK